MPVALFRVRLGVEQREGGAPGAANHQPLLDAEMAAQGLDVVHQVPSRVVPNLAPGRAAPGAALVEGDEPVALRVEQAAVAVLDVGCRGRHAEPRRAFRRGSRSPPREARARLPTGKRKVQSGSGVRDRRCGRCRGRPSAAPRPRSGTATRSLDGSTQATRCPESSSTTGGALAARGLGEGAAGMEAASARCRRVVRHHALDGARQPGACELGHGLKQRARIGVRRIAEQGLDVRLFDDGAGVHHVDPLRELPHHAQVVRDEEHRRACVLGQLVHQPQRLLLHRHIERRSRLVRQHQLGPVHQRHGDHHPLREATRKLKGIGGKDAVGIDDRHPPQPRARDLVGLPRRAGAPTPPDHLEELVAHLERGIERGHRVLEDHRDAAAANPAPVPFRHTKELGLVKADRPLDRHVPLLQQPQDGPHRHRLAAPGLAHDRHPLALLDRKADPVEHVRESLEEREPHVQIANFEERCHG